jgi:hypothetical protein
MHERQLRPANLVSMSGSDGQEGVASKFQANSVTDKASSIDLYNTNLSTCEKAVRSSLEVLRILRM